MTAMLLKTARAVTTGHQLRGPSLNPISTHVGPNALLRTNDWASLMLVPTQSASGGWRIDGNDEIDDTNHGLALNWADGATTPYVYNNDPSNYGGVVEDDMYIDGWLVPAGAYVFQFMDLSAGLLVYQGNVAPAPDVVFRGCRFRANTDATGFINNNGDVPQPIKEWVLYCDLGGSSSAVTDQGPDEDGLAEAVVASYCGGLVCYRNYVSLVGSGIFPKVASAFADLYENFIEEICNLHGDHLNGISFNGGENNARVKRNYIVTNQIDLNYTQIQQTDCISFFEDFGAYSGLGANPDATPGYQVYGNYMGGTGYCFYPPAGTYGDPYQFHLDGNLVTTSAYPIGSGEQGDGGGYFGPLYAELTWGSNKNTQSNNTWADGLNAGQSWV